MQPERIDRRTLKAQGIKRKPTIHEGVRARRLRRSRRPLNSQSRTVKNAALAKSRARRVDYPSIDRGQSRAAYNEGVLALKPEQEAEYWSSIDADRQTRELEELRAIHKPPEAFNEVIWLEERKRKLKRKKKRNI